MAAATELDPSPVNVRIKISALWTSMLFVFAYVDLFSFYRADFRADIEGGIDDRVSRPGRRPEPVRRGDLTR